MLKIENLSYHRNGRHIFSDINFKVESGTYLVVEGPNGSGKSTLLRILAGLLPIQEGALKIYGNEITNNYDFLAQNVEYVGHLNAVKKQMSLWDNLQFWNDVSGFEVLNNLKLKINDPMKISSFKDQFAYLCSAGQIRRVALSRLATSKKKIWLLDEPTTSLDQRSTQSFSRLIKEHCLKGGVAVIATHSKLKIFKIDSVTISLKPIKRIQKTARIDPFLAGEWE